MNYRCYQITLLGNFFLNKSGAVRSVAWMFMTGVPAFRRLGEYVTLDKTFYKLLCKQEVLTAHLLPNFHSYRILRGGLY
jgi:hypothetical protein